MRYRAMVSPIRRQGPHIPDRNLNFEEFGSQLGNSGKPLNLMNLEDLVKNVIYADEAGLSFQNSSSFSSSPPASNFLGNFNLNGTLNRKTVDEVWKEIVHQEHVRAAENRKSVQQQLPLMAIDPMVVVPHQQEDWFKFPMATGESNFQVSEMGSENLENHLALPLALSMVPASSSDCRPGVRRKDSVTDEAVEKTIERRQERMMKNRESAARSRARKQAYTNQLEQKVFHLRKTNNLLKKHKEVNRLLSLHSAYKPRFQLRRTGSAAF